MSRHHNRRRALPALLVAAALAATAPGPASALTHPPRTALASDGQCVFPAASIPGEPWSLQRVLLSELWRYATGKGVTVAVIDTGVDNTNPQLSGGAVVAGTNYLTDSKGNAFTDTVGHGTMVAGIIAARPASSTGFVGLAKDATILSLRQNDGQGSGGDVKNMAKAVDEAVSKGAGVINISQDVSTNGKPVYQSPDGPLGAAIAKAIRKGVVVVAAAGNENLSDPTYPASFPGVLGVGASDRDNERADGFSETGTSVQVAAPGVDMVSTVPKGGQCVDSGTSFAAPYAAAVAALLKQKYPTWTSAQIVARIEQTAQRTDAGRNQYIGWGVVDPVAALSDNSPPESAAVPTVRSRASAAPLQPVPMSLGETQADRDRRTAAYTLGIGLLAVLLIAGTAVVVRDMGRRRAG
ncbi:type VII secretion-associated serine protease mycosin [Streptacidiphilus carbonis]|uniref:type VII secretion-associated serine protease mycosin n=1 Tax=Streptacidiphilus carbonis TaxID=105422 RepID=UPI000A9A110B|nr:type VII secretion-associated serine protease mycosin [Streptacidiphilus carbonis]